MLRSSASLANRLVGRTASSAAVRNLRYMSGATDRVPRSADDLWEACKQRDGHEPEFLQAAHEVIESMKPVFEQKPEYIVACQSMLEPERSLVFRVPWLDDAGNWRVNRGYRVQFNSALGPYKGGLRLHPSVNLSVIKFLGFEQIFKNSLTTLSLGGGKGGSDFDPKGKSDNEVMRFCQSFMTELWDHIGADTDVPAGDIGVGAREIGYFYGQYKRLSSTFEGVLTGKGADWGGSLIRPEATGYGLVYFTQNTIKDTQGRDLSGLSAAVSGSGNVAQFTCEKLLDLGARTVTMSDSSGYIYEPEGITREGLAAIMEIKNKNRGRISDYCNFSKTATFHKGDRPWGCGKYDIALPCATQNEVTTTEAQQIIDAGVSLAVEGANMPCDEGAVETFHKNSIVFGPAKAANAGGVAVSGLEMAQNSQRMKWARDDVDQKLQKIMLSVYENSRDAAATYGMKGNLQAGANIAGFVKVADAMLAQGHV